MSKKKTAKKIFKYEVDINWSEEDGCFIAVVPELPGCKTHGDTRAEAAEMADEAIALHVESLEERGLDVPVPLAEEKLSGEFLVRTGDPELHRRLKRLARERKTNMNNFIVEQLRKLG